MHSSTTSTVLHFYPGACSRISLNALEEIGLPFEARLLNLARGEQKTPEYLTVNPKGKVPALVFGGQVLTETPAIIHFLATQYPEAGLLPSLSDPVRCAEVLGDLAWCSSALHPMVKQVLFPSSFTSGNPTDVKAMALQNFAPVAAQMALKFSAGEWWYGDKWSIVDVYVSWAIGVAKLGGAQEASHRALNEHAERVRTRASFIRALAREQAALVQHGITLPPGAL